MGKRLAIKGHPTRGKEVIELLEMMGGSNPFSNGMVIGNKATNCYYISEDTATKYISWDYIGPDEINEYEIFTLEEFLEKYPFKVGDFVRIPEYESEVRICKMKWTSFSDIDYLVYRNDDEEWYTAEELLDYNDNPQRCLDTDCCRNNMIKSLDNVYSIARCNTTGQGTYAIKIADGYKFDSIDENGNIIVKSIKPKYPTTYAECCEVLMGKTNFSEFSLAPIKYSNTTKFDNSVSYDAPHIELFNNLYKIFICRNAYWKIAGEEMGLDKPWKPDWSNNYDETKFCIYTTQNIISLDIFGVDNRILAFPTEEMRDAFYDNFKDLIEQCKELL